MEGNNRWQNWCGGSGSSRQLSVRDKIDASLHVAARRLAAGRRASFKPYKRAAFYAGRQKWDFSRSLAVSSEVSKGPGFGDRVNKIGGRKIRLLRRPYLLLITDIRPRFVIIFR